MDNLVDCCVRAFTPQPKEDTELADTLSAFILLYVIIFWPFIFDISILIQQNLNLMCGRMITEGVHTDADHHDFFSFALAEVKRTPNLYFSSKLGNVMSTVAR